LNNELFFGALKGTLKQTSETGYMNSELFLEWLNHFVAHVKPFNDDPVLLIMDNQASHCSLVAVLLCRDHHITLLTLPPHSSHKLQPLDKRFFGPLKTAYASDLEKWLVNHPEQGVTLFHVSGLFRVAYSKTATVGKQRRPSRRQESSLSILMPLLRMSLLHLMLLRGIQMLSISCRKCQTAGLLMPMQQGEHL
jgi:hypothetical protein